MNHLATLSRINNLENLITVLAIITLVLFFTIVFFYKMAQLHRNESAIWKEKYLTLDNDHKSLVTDHRDLDMKCRRVVSILEGEQMKQRINSMVEGEADHSFTKNPKPSNTHNTLQVEKNVKPFIKPVSGVVISDSTKNALLNSLNKEAS
jgi:hypothetical protein